MSRFLEQLFMKLVDPRPVIGRPTPQVVTPGRPTTVAPPYRPVWDERRWHRREYGNTVEVSGPYRVFDRQQNTWRSFDGQVIQADRVIAAYIADPPIEIKDHRHGPCFQLAQAPWFRVHWTRAPHTIDDALLYIERLLDEAINEV